MKFLGLLLSLLLPIAVVAKPSFITIKGYKVEYEIAGKGKQTVFFGGWWFGRII